MRAILNPPICTPSWQKLPFITKMPVFGGIFESLPFKDKNKFCILNLFQKVGYYSGFYSSLRDAKRRNGELLNNKVSFLCKGWISKNVSRHKCGWLLIFLSAYIEVFGQYPWALPSTNQSLSPVHSGLENVFDFIPSCKIGWDIWERVNWRNYLALTLIRNLFELRNERYLIFLL